MAVARVSRLISSSNKGFQDAVDQGVARANKTLRGLTGGEIVAHKVKIEKGKIVAKKAYADWSRFGMYTGALHEAAIPDVERPAHGHDRLATPAATRPSSSRARSAGPTRRRTTRRSPGAGTSGRRWADTRRAGSTSTSPGSARRTSCSPAPGTAATTSGCARSSGATTLITSSAETSTSARSRSRRRASPEWKGNHDG